MKKENIQQLKIPQHAKQRSRSVVSVIYGLILVLLAIATWFAWPRSSDDQRIVGKETEKVGNTAPATKANTQLPNTNNNKRKTSAEGSPLVGTGLSQGGDGVVEDSLLTVSGYIINRERIELSPRFMGVVNVINVKKGDAVKKGQVVAILDDAEYQAQVTQAQGSLEFAKIQVQQAELEVYRASQLVAQSIEMKATLEDAQLKLAGTQAEVKRLEGQLSLVRTYLDWTIIRSPIDGVVLEKLVDPNELVTPQSFGGTRGPSTALISLGDPKDLQVEIELNESDLSKIQLNQPCLISPEAYLDRTYNGHVVEIAPEANRQKGTLQIKVQIENPDSYLTPELSAKVDFLPMPAAKVGQKSSN